MMRNTLLVVALLPLGTRALSGTVGTIPCLKHLHFP